ncbi:MAG: phosphorybosylanthranilate isomerase, partial [Proteobacteria bacterium]|nr:phosphorybosylanthranilate isomerase [Pseudomonadota bacterium]
DQGVVQGGAHELLRYRHQIGATHIAILADVQVKHSSPLGGGTLLSQDVDDLCHRALADGVIVSGSGTGKAVDFDALKSTRIAAGKHPVFIGSGASLENVGEISKHAYGFIVGTTFKAGGILDAPVDVGRVASFMAEVGALRAKLNQ